MNYVIWYGGIQKMTLADREGWGSAEAQKDDVVYEQPLTGNRCGTPLPAQPAVHTQND